jgi:hypothetical protein
MGKPRADERQPASHRLGSRFALLLFVLFVLALVAPVVTLMISLLTGD